MTESAPWPWRSLLALLLIVAASVAELSIVWGVLCLNWTVPGILSGTQYVVEPISREKHPAMFWLTSLFWLALGVFLIAYDLFL